MAYALDLELHEKGIDNVRNLIVYPFFIDTKMVHVCDVQTKCLFLLEFPTTVSPSASSLC